MIRSAFEYHQKTAYHRDRMAGHFLDWQNQPDVFKTYPGIEPVPLPRDIRMPDKDLFTLVKAPAEKTSVRDITCEDLSGILTLSYGLTARAQHAGGDFYYRSAASAGALYPTEIYVAAEGVGGLDDGLYHFSVASHGLIPLRRAGEWRACLPGGTAQRPSLMFFLSAIFFRSAWKYRDRSYRYHLLDTGHVAENLVLALKAHGLPFSVSCDFPDALVNRLLGLDPSREVTLLVCRVPAAENGWNGEQAEIPELADEIRNASRVSPKETDFPAIREIHGAGSRIMRRAEAPALLRRLGPWPEKWTRPARPAETCGALRYGEAVFRRRSQRNFVSRPLPPGYLERLLDALCGPLEGGGTLPCTGFLVREAPGLDAGFHLLDRETGSVGRVDSECSTDRMARVCLDQAWLANAAVHFLFMANLDLVDETPGPRGYRRAMLAAGRLGERIYLAATALGLGCCGIGAFYDAEASACLGLNSESGLLYLVAAGPTKTKTKRETP